MNLFYIVLLSMVLGTQFLQVVLLIKNWETTVYRHKQENDSLRGINKALNEELQIVSSQRDTYLSGLAQLRDNATVSSAYAISERGVTPLPVGWLEKIKNEGSL